MPTHVKLIITPLEPFFASIRVAINPKYPAPTAESPLINADTAADPFEISPSGAKAAAAVYDAVHLIPSTQNCLLY